MLCCMPASASAREAVTKRGVAVGMATQGQRGLVTIKESRRLRIEFRERTPSKFCGLDGAPLHVRDATALRVSAPLESHINGHVDNLGGSVPGRDD